MERQGNLLCLKVIRLQCTLPVDVGLAVAAVVESGDVVAGRGTFAVLGESSRRWLSIDAVAQSKQDLVIVE